ncbi:MAG: WYL domain-containing protein [Helicobacter sp.]|nr:WYL domain-containing protein [Helicobacter sp.]
MQILWFNNKPYFIARMLISAEVAKYFIKKPLKTQRIIETLEDASLIIEIYINDKMQIKPIIYEHIPHIRLLEPLWLAKDIKQELQSFMQVLES